MRRTFCRLLLVPGLLMLLAHASAPAGGEETAGQSTWKIVSASEETDDYEHQGPISAWEEPSSAWEDTPAAPSTRSQPPVVTSPPTVQATTPRPTTAQSSPGPAVRPIIPSRQLTAARQQQTASNQLTNEQIRAAIEYGRASTSQGVGQMRRRSSTAPSRQASGRQGKPFQVVTRDPTVTPWLDLFRDEDLSQLPNYFTFVRPQFDQIETNRRNRADLTHLQREVQNVSTGVVGPQYRSAGVPATGHSPRFMDTAQFYGRWQR